MWPAVLSGWCSHTRGVLSCQGDTEMPVVLWKKSGKLWLGHRGPCGPTLATGTAQAVGECVWAWEAPPLPKLLANFTTKLCHFLIPETNFMVRLESTRQGSGLILDVLKCFHMAAMVLPHSYCQHHCHVNVQAKWWWKCQIQDWGKY